MDRGTVIVGSLLLISCIGFARLAVHVWSVSQQPAPSALVALRLPGADHPGRLVEMPAWQPNPASQVGGEEIGVATETGALDKPPAGERAPAVDAPLITAAENVAVATSTPVVRGSPSKTPLEVATAWTAVPPRPARPQLAPVPDVAPPSGESQQASEPTAAWVPEGSLSAVSGEPADVTPGGTAEPSLSAVAGPDNIQVARAPDRVVATQRSEDRPLRPARSVERDPLRWRNLFTDHLGPED
jgi:hypothetical protein